MSEDPDASRQSWRTPARWMLVAAVLASVWVVRPFLVELGAGLVFGYVAERPVDWLLRKFHREGNPRWHVALSISMVVGALLLLIVPAVVALWIALRDLATLLNDATPGELGSLGRRVVAWVQARGGAWGMRLNTADLMRRAQGLSGAAATLIARGAGRVLSATPAVIFSLVLVVVASATFAVQGRALRKSALPVLIPWAREREALSRTTAGVIEGVVLANIGVSLIQATIVAVATVALGIPNAALWSVASFALSFVPFVGTGLVTLSAAAYLFAMNRNAAGVAMLVVALVAGSIDNVLRPLLTQGSIELPFLWRLVAFVGGIAAFGIAGVIVGPLILAWATALWAVTHEPAAGRG
jgi:predicted PurR-regulated permease PerM